MHDMGWDMGYRVWRFKNKNDKRKGGKTLGFGWSNLRDGVLVLTRFSLALSSSIFVVCWDLRA